ncbi:MAG: hypothetical protein HC892_05530 [Saprospiraceae bacterium]|nr:hypothetical protein [Saprospiraceae bacterium]
MGFMVLLYNIGLQIYAGLIHLASLFNSKAKQWKVGRRYLFDNLPHQISTKTSWIWVHCASLGEFEQGRPIIEQLKQQYSQQGILLTFFLLLVMKYAKTMNLQITYATFRLIRLQTLNVF